METCDECGSEMIKKSRGEGFIVIGCRRGHSCYRTIDEKTGQVLQIKGLAVLREIQSHVHHVTEQPRELEAATATG